MSRLFAFAAATMVLAGISVMPAGAGAPVDPLQRLDVVKEIVGPVPPGAEFVVDVDCEGAQGPTVDETLTFTEPGSQVVDLDLVSLTCTVEEVEAAGATVTYACEAVLTSSTCTSDRTFTNTSDEAETIVTVTNTFPEPPPPAPIEVGPTFTG